MREEIDFRNIEIYTDVLGEKIKLSIRTSVRIAKEIINI